MSEFAPIIRSLVEQDLRESELGDMIENTVEKPWKFEVLQAHGLPRV